MRTLQTRHRTLAFPRRPLVMGIVNLNDDSFSGDGRIDCDWALQRCRELIHDGADILDIGAESARTNRAAISETEEIRRLTPFLKQFHAAIRDTLPADDAQVFPPLLSINTWRPAVAEAALAITGDILNDMSGLSTPENALLCARHNAALLIMHTQGPPKIAHTHVTYTDVVAEVIAFFKNRIALARASGLSERSILLDPGIDFAKQRADNLAIYRHLEHIVALGFPVLLPVSRKSVIGAVLDLPDPSSRDAGTIACVVSGARHGAAIFRVHNVRATRQALLLLDAVKTGSPASKNLHVQPP